MNKQLTDREKYKKANNKGRIVAYYLAKFDLDAYKDFGYKTKYNSKKEVEYDLSIKLGMKPNSYLKRMRDKYDVLFYDPHKATERRQGYYQRPLEKSFLNVASYYKDLEKEELYNIVINLFDSDNYYDNNVNPILAYINNNKKQTTSNQAKRSKTGLKGEKLFIQKFQSDGYLIIENKKINGKLDDKRYDQCGYDFEIKDNKEIYYIEVKSLSEDQGGISFTNKEWSVAKEKGESFILCIIHNVNSNEVEKFHFISNPFSKIEPKKRESIVLQINYEVSNKKIRKLI